MSRKKRGRSKAARKRRNANGEQSSVDVQPQSRDEDRLYDFKQGTTQGETLLTVTAPTLQSAEAQYNDARKPHWPTAADCALSIRHVPTAS